MNAIKVKKTFASSRPLALIAVGLVALAVAAPGSARAQSTVLPQSVLEMLGAAKLRQMCYNRCSAEFDEDVHSCNETYPDLVFDRRWGVCVGEALAVYNKCTEYCSPVGIVIENPFGQ
jgi:hypothetical protein